MYESGEMYLENILILSEQLDKVRAVDLSHKMKFSKTAVSHALSKLKESGHISIDDHGRITLTKSGKILALKVYSKHKILKDALMKIGVDKIIAEKDACRIEHYVSNETIDAITKYISKIQDNKNMDGNE